MAAAGALGALGGAAGRALVARGLSGSAAGALLPAAERADGTAFRKWARAAPEPLGVEGLGRVPFTECTELPSGLRVATARVPHATSATIGVRISSSPPRPPPRFSPHPPGRILAPSLPDAISVICARL